MHVSEGKFGYLRVDKFLASGNGGDNERSRETSGAVLTIQPESDSEAVFDPFGFGFDSSDQIKFTGAQINTPEPASLALLGVGLLGLGLVGRRRSA